MKNSASPLPHLTGEGIHDVSDPYIDRANSQNKPPLPQVISGTLAITVLECIGVSWAAPALVSKGDGVALYVLTVGLCYALFIILLYTVVASLGRERTHLRERRLIAVTFFVFLITAVLSVWTFTRGWLIVAIALTVASVTNPVFAAIGCSLSQKFYPHSRDTD